MRPAARRPGLRRPPTGPGLRLRTLADVFAYAAAEDVRLRIDGTETQVRRPKAHRPGRCAFVPGKKEQVAASGSGVVGGCPVVFCGFYPMCLAASSPESSERDRVLQVGPT
jgi:hypothetical protein